MTTYGLLPTGAMLRFGLACLFAATVAVSTLFAQIPGLDPVDLPPDDLEALGEAIEEGAFGGLDLDGTMGAEVSASAVFTVPTESEPARLFVTATMKPGWHIYSITQPAGPLIRTQIKTPNLPPGVELAGPFQATAEPTRKTEPVFDNLTVEYHEDKITWWAPLEIAPGTDLATLKITGAVYAQACKTACIMPDDYPFTATLGKAPVVVSADGTSSAADPRTPDPARSTQHTNIATVVGLAFLGGLILNLMPCVLPVISLKLFSFLQQGGESRGRVFLLNVCYTAGLLLVFFVLAFLAATLGMAWGEQFTLPWFKVAMTALIFVMALCFLGVWEIPIPGFVGSGAAGNLQAKEGVEGAFAKGVLATILATPCSGPFLGPVFGYLLNQPAYMAYVVFGSVGLGMASPYLVIGAFPGLISFLPKPGAWMDTLKQIMGFFLLGTMVYLFWTMNSVYFVPTLALLVGLWFACWWIGRTPLTASAATRATAWIGGLATAAVIGVFAFTFLLAESLIPWVPFSPETLQASRDDGKTVMVDFTANWCLTCQANKNLVIETSEVADLIEENGVVPLLADFTDYSPAVKKALNDLGRNSIPVLAIWPAGAADDEVIILDDVITQGQLLDALQKAGPSQEAGSGATGSAP